MKKVYLCIRCKHGVYINLVMAENIATAFVQAWINNDLPLTKGGMVHFSSPPEVASGGIRPEEIILMHTQSVEAGAMLGQPPTSWAGGPRGSGI